MILLSAEMLLPLLDIYPDWYSYSYSGHFPSLLLFLLTSCCNHSLFNCPSPSAFHFAWTSILSLICHSESWGVGSLLRSDSYKILIGTRNMIGRENEWEGWKEKYPHENKLCLRKAMHFLSFLHQRWFSGSILFLSLRPPSACSVLVFLLLIALTTLLWSPDRVNYWY